MKTSRHIDIMGIVNLTDDSYFADSRCSDVYAAIKRIDRMVSEGADVIDLGACSSRPGSVPVGADVEWSRLEPVLKAVRDSFPDIKISIDTYWSSVVERAHSLIGDFIVNDISAGEDDLLMLPTVGRLGLGYVAMHKRGTSVSMPFLTDYEDVIAEVTGYFKDFAVKAARFGIKDWILDPGFGFAKTVEQNYRLLAGLPEITAALSEICAGPRVLVGVSRKSMIYKPLESSPEQVLPATQAVHMAALMKGVDILRVHDVKEAKQTVSLFKLMDSPKY